MIQSPSPFNSNSYLSFDGTSFRDLLIQKLNDGGIFTDQNFAGSHIAALNDIIGYFYSTLVYYINQTTAGAQFNETQIYENMNRLVRLISYNPTGAAGQTVGYSITVNPTQLSLGAGNYIIPRYSNITVGGSIYSFGEDVPFSVEGTRINELVTLPDQYLLHQGIFQEYPLYNALGTSNEIIYLATDSSLTLDHFYIDVYVKSVISNIWTQWKRIDSLLTSGNTNNHFEARLNENLRYELKFGNGINGVQLNQGDKVQVYYLSIDPAAEDLAAGAIYPSYPVLFNSLTYTNLISAISLDYSKFLNSNQLPNLVLSNGFPSTSIVIPESVEDIRRNAPGIFRSQQRLTTTNDYEYFINSQFGTILADVKAMNNEDYLNSHMAYLYKLGLQQPQLDNNVLFNQIQYANACNFNNIYVYLVPSNNQIVINPIQKQTILHTLAPYKIATSQVVLMDPEYMEISLCVPGDQLNIKNTPNILQITKTTNSRRADSAIKANVILAINNYFSRDNLKLGQTIDLLRLNTELLSIEGVIQIATYSPTLQLKVPGISVLLTDIKYPNSTQIYVQNIPLGVFQYAVFSNTNLNNQVSITNTSGSITTAEF